MFLRVGMIVLEELGGWLVPSSLGGEGGEPGEGNPLPSGGEGGERSEPGEGDPSISERMIPSPASPPPLRFGGSAPSSPRGEGTGARGEVAEADARPVAIGCVLCPSNRSHRYCATLVS